MRRIDRMDRSNERGAVAVLVAILMTALLGFAAFGIDVAHMASDKQQLQNGADAAALAIAQSCALDEATCNNADGDSTSSAFAATNRLDSAAAGEVVTASLSPTTGEVTVRTAGTTNHWFAQFLGTTASEIEAEATAVWEPLGGGDADLPLAISLCEIVSLAESTGAFEFVDGKYEYKFDSELVTIFLSKNTVTEGCYPEPSGNWLPGGFGWLDTSAGICSAEISADDSASSDTGVSPPSDCTAAYMTDLVGETVAIPIFNQATVEGTGTKAVYYILGWVGFHVTSLQFGGQFKEYVAPDTELPCKGEERCIRGYFTELVDDGEGSDDASDLGARAVRLTLSPSAP